MFFFNPVEKNKKKLLFDLSKNEPKGLAKYLHNNLSFIENLYGISKYLIILVNLVNILIFVT
jgi:hypothetical protein